MNLQVWTVINKHVVETLLVYTSYLSTVGELQKVSQMECSMQSKFPCL